MSEQPGPYAAPRARLAEAEVTDQRRRPVSVYVALVLIAINLLIGVTLWLNLVRLRHVMNISPSLILWPPLIWAVTLLAGYQIWRGRQWARVLFVAMALFALLGTLLRFWRNVLQSPNASTFISDPAAMTVFFLPSALVVIAACLLLFPGGEWFGKRQPGS